MATQISLIYVTFPSEEEALNITQMLLESKHVGCVNILGPIKSLYPWEGEIQSREEVPALLKLPKENVPSVMEALQNLHPYETPAILEIPVGRASSPFCQWIVNSIR